MSPESLLIFSTGPLCGTLVPNAGRVEVIAKSPLTGIYGDANAGGFFGPELKFAGWDAIVVTGQSPHPVYLAIADERADLRDASELWGLSTSETETAIRRTWRFSGQDGNDRAGRGAPGAIRWHPAYTPAIRCSLRTGHSDGQQAAQSDRRSRPRSGACGQPGSLPRSGC